MGDMREISAITYPLIEHLEEHLKDGVFLIFGIGTGVNVEQDNIGGMTRCAMHIGIQRSVDSTGLTFFLKEVDGVALLAILVSGSVFQQVREDFDEVRFT